MFILYLLVFNMEFNYIKTLNQTSSIHFDDQRAATMGQMVKTNIDFCLKLKPPSCPKIFHLLEVKNLAHSSILTYRRYLGFYLMSSKKKTTLVGYISHFLLIKTIIVFGAFSTKTIIYIL